MTYKFGIFSKMIEFAPKGVKFFHCIVDFLSEEKQKQFDRIASSSPFYVYQSVLNKIIKKISRSCKCEP